jgi:release factor glutamine methyltransferase
MRSFSYILYTWIYKPVLKIYLKTDSAVRFDGFHLKIFRGVFHPKLFFSTNYFYSFIQKQNLEGLKFLEIGSGSGILSLLAYKKGARVTAVDIDEKAVENTRLNFSKNFDDLKNIRVLQSDLFTNLPKEVFDTIVINPPYYFKRVEVSSQYAWYCGENGEYFEKLFSGISDYMYENSAVFIILEENCEINRIKAIASKNNFDFELADEKQIKWEKNFIFRLKMI